MHQYILPTKLIVFQAGLPIYHYSNFDYNDVLIVIYDYYIPFSIQGWLKFSEALYEQYGPICGYVVLVYSSQLHVKRLVSYDSMHVCLICRQVHVMLFGLGILNAPEVTKLG